MTEILLSKIMLNPNQPRKTFDEASIDELAGSIQENGLLQPILVEDNLDGTYTLVGGERRLRAFTRIQRQTIPATVRERTNHGGRELLIHAVVENVQREAMNPIDEAKAYQNLHDVHGLSWTEIGRAIGKDGNSIHSRIILLKLDPEIQTMIQAGKFSSTSEVARAFLAIPDRTARLKLAEKVCQERMTLKQIIDVANRLAASLTANRKEAKTGVPALRLAQRKTGIDVDEKTAPSGWNALKQAGKAPAWSSVAESVSATCRNCSLSATANEITCRDCPMVELVVRLVKYGN